MKSLLRYSFTILLVLSCLIIVPACQLGGGGTTTVTEDSDVPAVSDTTATTTTTTEATTTTTSTSASTSTSAKPTTTSTSASTSTSAKPTTTTTTTTGTTGTTKPFDANQGVSFPDTLFIGDSRSVGFRDYGKVSDATYFCDVGLSAYSVSKKAVDVKGAGTITLDTLLSQKQFKQVYIMLGINELGYNLQTTAGKYSDLIAKLKAAQPDAKIIVQSTLHVTAACDAKGKFTNKRINDFNTLIAALADGSRVFYLDMNPALDDGNGCLTASYAGGDGIHIKAKYYLLWRDYLDKHRI